MLPSLEEIRKRRVKLGISQRKLATYLSVSQSAIAKIESGRMKPTYELVRRIFDFLDSLQTPAIGLVGEIASKPLVAVGKDDPVEKAVKLLQEYGFKQLPVRDGELWVGSLSERSVSRYLLKAKDPTSLLSRRVTEVMDEAFPILPEDTPISSAISLLQHSQAVLTTRRGRVMGIVTNADLLKLITKS